MHVFRVHNHSELHMVHSNLGCFSQHVVTTNGGNHATAQLANVKSLLSRQGFSCIGGPTDTRNSMRSGIQDVEVSMATCKKITVSQQSKVTALGVNLLDGVIQIGAIQPHVAKRSITHHHYSTSAVVNGPKHQFKSYKPLELFYQSVCPNDGADLWRTLTLNWRNSKRHIKSNLSN